MRLLKNWILLNKPMSLKQNVIKEFERAFPVRSVLSCDDGVMIITSYKFKQFLPLLLSLIEQEVMKCDNYDKLANDLMLAMMGKGAVSDKNWNKYIAPILNKYHQQVKDNIKKLFN
jgi:hypothetical protein